MATYDAVLVGSGINTLTAAALLARDGWSVCVLERTSRDLVSEGAATGVVLADGEAIAASWRSRAGAPPSALRVRR